MITIYLNLRTAKGTETVGQFTRGESQSINDFLLYVNKMLIEYHISGMNVYKSSRCCK